MSDDTQSQGRKAFLVKIKSLFDEAKAVLTGLRDQSIAYVNAKIPQKQAEVALTETLIKSINLEKRLGEEKRSIFRLLTERQDYEKAKQLEDFCESIRDLVYKLHTTNWYDAWDKRFKPLRDQHYDPSMSAIKSMVYQLIDYRYCHKSEPPKEPLFGRYNDELNKLIHTLESELPNWLRVVEAQLDDR